MAKNYSELSQNILTNIGGKQNVKEIFHCVTRLRFYLHDEEKVDVDKLKDLDGVIGVRYSGDQLQIIIGEHVSDVYKEITNQIGDLAIKSGEVEVEEEKKKKFSLETLFETLAAIFLPVVPALAGSGMIKGLIIILTNFLNVDPNLGIMQLLTIASDAVFYFFPFLVAWSASNRFKTNTALALGLAGVLLHPIMTSGLAAGEVGFDVFGLTVPFVRYASSSIPIILTVLVLSYVYPFVDNLLPKALRMVFTAMIVLLIMVPITLIVVAPLANYLAQGLASLVKWLFDLSPIVAGFVVGGTRPLVVLSGMHLSLGAIMIENIATFGYDIILPVNTMGTMAMVGAALGTWYKSKDQNTKTISFSAFISAFIGITEPTIYGVLLKFKNALIATMIAGGIAGAYVAFFGATASAYVNSSIMSLPVFMGPGFLHFCIGMAMATAIAFILIQIMGLSEEKDLVEQDSEVNLDYTITSPLVGEVKELSQINDEVFAKGLMGKGIAIKPKSNLVIAPFDGEVVSVYPTKHAISLRSNTGIELIIHLGIDTANLKGEYFDVKVSEGQKIKRGDTIAVVDFESIEKRGYSIWSPIIVPNVSDFLDVIPSKINGSTKSSDNIIEVIK
ncbi:beta-glucoside-specific PTS transporter subunit IIABC [Fundicoccus culcitae]|uniref:Beta-glucoside-specific PTS transporter subunit IIABC n=1 Tax=Fundicoccus culcitae TaxID=2969821 RepID=A0ABY5P4U9_9LACT|nr:beta-glucoside-specific PTS transporter subunit IIABC [Fundicoccus culcitae]UUX33773.1 beta-glucoside-specific PTS transporter subunit IIABC [Fundicoccus culcitae]